MKFVLALLTAIFFYQSAHAFTQVDSLAVTQEEVESVSTTAPEEEAPVVKVAAAGGIDFSQAESRQPITLIITNGRDGYPPVNGGAHLFYDKNFEKRGVPVVDRSIRVFAYQDNTRMSQSEFHYQYSTKRGFSLPKQYLDRETYKRLMRVIWSASPHCPVKLSIHPSSGKILKVAASCDPAR